MASLTVGISDCSAWAVRTTTEKSDIGMLIEGIVIGWPNLRIQRPFSDVVDDADDLLYRFWIQVGVAKSLANRILTRKILLRESLIDDDDLRLGEILRVSECAASQEFRLQVLQNSLSLLLVHLLRCAPRCKRDPQT